MFGRYQRQAGSLILTLMLGLVGCGIHSAGEPVAVAPTPSASARPVSVATPVSEPVLSFASLPQSRTIEGYYALGDPNASTTLEFYSDFL